MIARLQIKNFQKHKNLSIELDPAITTIVGPSDAGKSAILRSLRWLCFNKPDGASFIREGKKYTRIKLELDGTSIERHRGTGKNTYKIGKKELVSFGRGGVPDPVADLLNMGPHNFQRQHDAPFWFSLSPGEVSRELNAIADLNIIDEGLKRAAAATRKSKTVAEVSLDRLNEAKSTLKQLDFVPRMHKQWVSLCQLQEQHAKDADAAEALDVLCSKIAKAKKKLKAQRKQLKAANGLLKQKEAHKSLTTYVSNLSSRCEDARRLKAIVVRGTPDISQLAMLREKYVDRTTRIERLQKHLQKIKQTRKEACQKKKQLKASKDMLPSRCPTCGTATAR